MLEIIICLLAGIGAGLGTGFAGMSAAAVISPMLIVFLGVDPYYAVGIALASDVLASLVSAITYGKNKNLDIKNGLLMLSVIIVFTIVGSVVAKLMPTTTMGNFSTIMTLFLGLKFIIAPSTKTKEHSEEISKKKKIIGSILCGILIGYICGFVGAGGGMMMLLILTTVLGYELKTAVGTSVFIMTFTALTGAISHFAFGDPGVMPSNFVLLLILCITFTFIFARIGAYFANKFSSKTLNRATGIILTTLGISILIFSFFH